MTPPLTTPLILPSTFNEATNQDEQARLIPQIVQASALLQGACHRRFDEYIGDERYTARLVVKGGDLLSYTRLSLRADLRSLTTLALDIPLGGGIDDGTVSTDDTDIILSEDAGGSQANSGRELILDEYTGGSFVPSGNPRKSIGVRGVWGFGGQWVNTGATVRSSYTAGDTTLTISSASLLEAGMVIKVGTEYLYVESVTGSETPESDTAAVSGAYNGSTAANHDADDVIYRWEAHPLVQALIIRQLQWSEVQKESPMSGSLTVGDFTFPVDTNGLPKDVYDTIHRTGLAVLSDRIVKA